MIAIKEGEFLRFNQRVFVKDKLFGNQKGFGNIARSSPTNYNNSLHSSIYAVAMTNGQIMHVLEKSMVVIDNKGIAY